MKLVRPGVFFMALVAIHSGSLFGALPETYQTFSAVEKQQMLWDRVEQSPWEGLPAYNNNNWSSVLKNIKSLFSLSKTFDHSSDEIPEGGVKFIHTYGSVVKFTFEPEAGHPFTGIYKTGGRGLARLSLAANPDVVDYTPGMALKFLIDGQPSLNIMAMNSLEGQGQNRNFFAKVFSNKIDPPTSWTLWLLGKVFELARKPANDLPVNHLAMVHENGTLVADVSSPEQLFLRPSAEIRNQITQDSSEDLRTSLSHIDAGTVLYDVYGLKDGDEVLIGRMKTDSEFIASRYGDKILFFQHRR